MEETAYKTIDEHTETVENLEQSSATPRCQCLCIGCMACRTRPRRLNALTEQIIAAAI